MGIRGEIFSCKMFTPKRTYFFNVKENRNGDVFLNIVESKKHEAEGFARQSVIVFEEDMEDFIKNFEQTIKYIKDRKK
jgi:hypothetical protein